MLRELMHAGVSADLVLGSSVGAMNAAYFPGAAHAAGVNKLEEVWRGLRRHDVFPVTFRSVLGFMGGADNLIDPSNLRKLIERNIPFANLEDAPIPVHVVATNLGGAAICLSSGPAVEALLASAAIPAAFPSVRIGEHHLIDGAVGCNTPILNAADLGADRIIVLPTGLATGRPPIRFAVDTEKSHVVGVAGLPRFEVWQKPEPRYLLEAAPAAAIELFNYSGWRVQGHHRFFERSQTVRTADCS
jgi:predicted acylesterase/phospholipase RssA